MMAGNDGPGFVDLALLDPDGVFPARLAGDRETLAALMHGMQAAGLERHEEYLRQIARLAHRLAGAAGTFGYAEVSDAALVLEELIIDRPTGQDTQAWPGVLRQAADALLGTLGDSLVPPRPQK